MNTQPWTDGRATCRDCGGSVVFTPDVRQTLQATIVRGVSASCERDPAHTIGDEAERLRAEADRRNQGSIPR